MAIQLSDDQRDEAVAAIQAYSEENMEEPMGNIAASALLEFFVQEIGPSVFNQAVAQARDLLQTRIMDLDVEIHETEFPFSRRRGGSASSRAR